MTIQRSFTFNVPAKKETYPIHFGLRRVKTHRTAMLIANQLVSKKNGSMKRKEALSKAYEYIRKCKDEGVVLYEVTFEKKDGSLCTRIVIPDWIRYNSVKGTGKPVTNRKLFVDCAKVVAGLSNTTISAYHGKYQIIKAK